MTTQLLPFSIVVVFLFVLICLLPSCGSNSSDDDKSISINHLHVSLIELKRFALDSGNTDSYDQLAIAFMDLPHGEFKDIAIQMAIKHEYSQAYYDVYYQCLMSTNRKGVTISLDSCDEQTRIQAIEYLRMAYELGHHQAIEELDNLIKEGIIAKEEIASKKVTGK